jgi:hypothetical protein
MNRTAALLAVGIVASGSAVFASNSLTVVPTGLNGTNHSLQVNLDTSTNNVFVVTQHPNGETHYRFSFWIDPTQLTNLAPNSSIRIGAVNSDLYGQRLVIFLRRDSPGTPDQYQINCWGLEDTGEPTSYSFLKGVNMGPYSGAVPNQVEIEWTRSSGESLADAVFRIQRITPGNVGLNQTKNLTMYHFVVDYALFGVLAGSGNHMTGSGSYLFDEFQSFR